MIKISTFGITPIQLTKLMFIIMKMFTDSLMKDCHTSFCHCLLLLPRNEAVIT